MVTRPDPSFGVNVLLTERARIFALVKKTWRDFEVTEESLDRHTACVVDSGIPSFSHGEDFRGTSGATLHESDVLPEPFSRPEDNKDQADPQRDQPWTAGNMSRCWTLLQTLVETERARSIARFSTNSNIEGNLSVVVLGDKPNRTSFHKCVRALFPHLACDTKRDIASSAATIQLYADKHFNDLCRVMPEREAKRLLWYFHCGDPTQSLDLDVKMDREQRRELHHVLHALFGQTLEAKTLQGFPRCPTFPSFPQVIVSNDQIRDVDLYFSDVVPSFGKAGSEDPNTASETRSFVQVRFRPRKRGKKRKFCEAASTAKEAYLQFVLEKHNLELLDALHLIANAVGAQLQNFSYAGIKDRRALTRQFVSVCGVPPEKLQEVKELLSHKGIYLGSFQWQQKPLRLGQLYANHFTLQLRGARCQDSSLIEMFRAAITSVKEQGFINLYGPQRFGLGTTGLSHHIGHAMLLGNTEKAVSLLLAPSSVGSASRMDQAREYFIRTKDAAAAMQLLPASSCKDRLLLRALKRFGCTENGYRLALLALPYASRIFYIQAYTSWLWNIAAAYRVQLSKSVMTGDLVVPRSFSSDENVRLDSDSKSVMVVTEEDRQALRYSLFDVVLPLIGRNCVYPENEVGDMMRQMLADDKLCENDFRLSWLHLNVSGSVRYLIARPDYLEWEIADSDTERTSSASTLTPDREKHSCLTLDEFVGEKADRSGQADSHGKIGDATSTLQGTQSGCCDICLKFSLTPSCYATSLLRELTGAGYSLAKQDD